MTIIKLNKILSELIKNGKGRTQVCVDKSTFSHPCESDGVTILQIEGAELQSHWIDDGDGCAALRRDGSQRNVTSFVIYGELHETPLL